MFIAVMFLSLSFSSASGQGLWGTQPLGTQLPYTTGSYPGLSSYPSPYGVYPSSYPSSYYPSYQTSYQIPVTNPYGSSSFNPHPQSLYTTASSYPGYLSYSSYPNYASYPSYAGSPYYPNYPTNPYVNPSYNPYSSNPYSSGSYANPYYSTNSSYPNLANFPPPQNTDVAFIESGNGKSVKVAKGQTLGIILSSNQVAGYTWILDDTLLNTNIVSEKSSQFLPAFSTVLGITEYEQLIYYAEDTGITTIKLSYKRYWENTEDDTYEIEVIVE